MNFTLLVAVLLTAIAFVGIVIALSNAIAPRSYNVQKMEPYECWKWRRCSCFRGQS